MSVDLQTDAREQAKVAEKERMMPGAEIFIRALLDEGVDLAMVARQVGHSNVQTTARYERRDQAALQGGVLRLDVPFDGE